MSTYVIIHTPLPITGLKRGLKLYSFKDLYAFCCKNHGFFEKLAKAGTKDEVAKILNAKGVVLPRNCFDVLCELLKVERAVREATTNIENKVPWPKEGLLYWHALKSGKSAYPATLSLGSPNCVWPNCPTDDGETPRIR